jgi:hypothetical protein
LRNPVRHALLAALAAVAFAACTEPAGPVDRAPAAPARAIAASRAPDLSRLATFRTRPTITIAWAKQWIGPAGGRLEFQGFAIDVPAGAVDRLTQFSIRLPVDPYGSDRVVAELGPHNVAFARPVAIELPFAGTSIDSDPFAATVLWWDEGSRRWVDMGAALTADGLRLRSLTGHFSLYGAATTAVESGGVTVSGG